MLNITTRQIILIAVVALLLGGCATVGPNPYGATTYTGVATRTEQQVSFGTVVSVAAANVLPGDNGQTVSTGVGAIAGGIAGSAAGNGRGQALTTLAGLILGGMAGNAVGSSIGTVQGVIITVRLDSGIDVAITQGVDRTEIFKDGERVEVLKNTTDGTARVLALQS